MQRGRQRLADHARQVSILTGSEEPVQHDLLHDRAVGGAVSILTGSEEPVQLTTVTAMPAGIWCFNPHRLRRAGATADRGPPEASSHVSILTGSEEPVQPEISRPVLKDLLVSILTGSEEPVQPHGGENPPRRAGVSILTGSEEPVQPGPGPYRRLAYLVSILTGSEEPVQRISCLTTGGHGIGFNPHRLRRAGATPPAGAPRLQARVSILTGSEEPVQRQK